MLFERLKTHDIFISYVVEDREIVNAFVKGLTEKGLRVWYAHEQLKIGISIKDTIKDGLIKTRYGLVLISPEYKSYWAYGELHNLFTDKTSDKLFPVLHNTTIEEIRNEIHGIHDLYCRDTAYGIDKIIDEICDRVERKSRLYYAFIDIIGFVKRHKRWAMSIFFMALILISVGFTWLRYKSLRPEDKEVESEIKQRTKSIDDIADVEFKGDISNNDTEQTSLPEIIGLVSESKKHSYVFYNGTDYIHNLAELKNEGIIPTIPPIDPPFGLTDFRAYVFKNKKYFKAGLVNISPIQYKIVDTRLMDAGLYEVDVKYTNAIRYINIGIYVDLSNNTSTRIVNLWGTKPNETLVFEKNGDDWQLIQIR